MNNIGFLIYMDKQTQGVISIRLQYTVYSSRFTPGQTDRQTDSQPADTF